MWESVLGVGKRCGKICWGVKKVRGDVGSVIGCGGCGEVCWDVVGGVIELLGRCEEVC